MVIEIRFDLFYSTNRATGEKVLLCQCLGHYRFLPATQEKDFHHRHGQNLSTLLSLSGHAGIRRRWNGDWKADVTRDNMTREFSAILFYTLLCIFR